MYAVYMHPVRQFEIKLTLLEIKNSHRLQLQGLYRATTHNMLPSWNPFWPSSSTNQHGPAQ